MQNFVRFDKILFSVLIAIVPGVLLDGFVQYNAHGLSPFFYRDVIMFSVVMLSFLFYKMGLFSQSHVLVVSDYTIVLLFMGSLAIGVKDPNFQFETYFLKVQLILVLIIFGLGMLIHFRHIMILLVLNVAFIICCSFAYPSFPIEKFVFFGMIVSSTLLVAFYCQRLIIKFSKKIKEANRCIQIKNEELREMNQSKDDLFRIIGHDLRTPFHQLTCLVEMIDEVDNEEEKARIKGLLQESADKGNQLLEDLLNWGKTYKQQSEILLEKQEIRPIINRVFAFSNLDTQAKQIRLINRLPKDLEISINSTMMETVIRNLIANAIKFSHRGSDIVVKSEKLEQHVRISIADQGVGICKERLFRLFKTERNESTSGTENEEGSGFGLNIAKKLVEKQNGTFEVKSIHNKGTVINLYFPFGQSA